MAATTLAFVGPEDKARATTQFLNACKAQGLRNNGLLQLVKWAAPTLPEREPVLMVAMYEHTTGCKVDLSKGLLVAAPLTPP